MNTGSKQAAPSLFSPASSISSRIPLYPFISLSAPPLEVRPVSVTPLLISLLCTTLSHMANSLWTTKLFGNLMICIGTVIFLKNSPKICVCTCVDTVVVLHCFVDRTERWNSQCTACTHSSYPQFIFLIQWINNELFCDWKQVRKSGTNWIKALAQTIKNNTRLELPKSMWIGVFFCTYCI